jgi:hypothetical protein
METRQLLIFVALSVMAAVAVIGAVTMYQSAQHPPATGGADVRVESDKSASGTTVDTPFTHVETGKDGTKVEAPGVKIETPPSTEPPAEPQKAPAP